MMSELTERQKAILMSIIHEFMDTADEVGSRLLVDKYKMDVSSATIRNEMMRLADLGYLTKSHISSGRYPTDQALRLFFHELDTEEILDPLEENEIQQGIFRERFDKERLLKTILEILSEHSNSASFIMNDDTIRYYGVSELMQFQELQKIATVQRVLDLLEHNELLMKLVKRVLGDEISLVIGSETGIQDLDSCSIAYSVIPFWGNTGTYFGVIGSRRVNFSHVIPVMRKIRESVEASLRGWQ